MATNINLAPGTEYIIAARKRRTRLYLISVAIVVIFTIAYGVLFFYVQALEQKNTDIQAGISVASADLHKKNDIVIRVAEFEKRLTQTKALLDTHVYWESLFADLERLLPTDTVLTSFEAKSTDTTVSIQGTTPSIDAVAQAMASLSAGPAHASVFKNGIVKSVSRADQKNGEVTSTRYSFVMTLEVDPVTLRNKISK
jgi:Tfp pilus assembly protein PilN